MYYVALYKCKSIPAKQPKLLGRERERERERGRERERELPSKPTLSSRFRGYHRRGLLPTGRRGLGVL